MGKTAEDFNGLHLGKLEKVGLAFLKCHKVSFLILGNHPFLLCGWDFGNRRLLHGHFED